MVTLSDYLRIAAAPAQQLGALAVRAYLEGVRIGADVAFDTALNSWHYIQSRQHAAEVVAERAFDVQRSVVAVYLAYARR